MFTVSERDSTSAYSSAAQAAAPVICIFRDWRRPHQVQISKENKKRSYNLEFIWSLKWFIASLWMSENSVINLQTLKILLNKKLFHKAVKQY